MLIWALIVVKLSLICRTCSQKWILCSGVTDKGERCKPPPPGKLNVKTGPPVIDILIFSFL